MNINKKWNKKGALVIRDYLIGLIVFSLIISLGFLMIVDLSTTYNNTEIIDPQFQENYNKLTENTELAQEIFDATNSEQGLSLIGTADILLKSTFSVINLVFGSLVNVGKQLKGIPEDFGIPTQVTNLVLISLMSVLMIFIVLGIINAVNKTGGF